MNIGLFLVSALVAALVSYVLTPVAGIIAHRIGAVDLPGPRKVHQTPIPRLGGLAVLAGLLLGAIMMWWLVPQASWALPTHVYLGIGLGVLPIIGVSIRDDVKPLNARTKFLVHLLGASIAVGFGIALNPDIHLFGQTVSIGAMAVPLSILWIVAATNAFNLVDGLDGLSSGLALISAVSLTAVFVIEGQMGLASAVFVIAGALCGFLPYNLYPARMFLGDTGATAIGFCLAALALGGEARLSTGFATLLPVFILGMPIAETAISIARRSLKRLDHRGAGNVFTPDKNHIHHRLMALGIGHREAVLILYGAGLFLAGGALASLLMSARQAALMVIALMLAGFLGLQRLGYDEFAVIRRGVALRVYDAPVFKSSMFVVFLDLSFVALAAYAAVALRTDDWQLRTHRAAAFGMIAILAPITVAVFSRMGLYRDNWRLAGVEEFGHAAGAVLIASALGLMARLALFTDSAPLSLYSIYAMMSLLLVIGSRASHQFLEASQRPAEGVGMPALIYGAGRQGAGAVRELLTNPTTRLRPVAFIDDDPSKMDRLVNGVPVVGSVLNLESAIRRFGAGAVIVTSDRIPDRRLARVGALCQRAGVTLLKMQVTFDRCLGAPVVPDTGPEGHAAATDTAIVVPVRSRLAIGAAAGVPAPSLPGWRLPNLPASTATDAAQPAPVVMSHPCPSCRSLTLHRSHARRFAERMRKKLTPKRPYRCDACGWRGWRPVPDIAIYEPVPSPAQPPALDALDNISTPSQAAGWS